mgnify:CR=1 FL=1
MKVTIEWVERNKRYMDIEVDSIEELSCFMPVLGEGKDSSISFKSSCKKFTNLFI